ncbi:MAG: sigma-54 dependent transcriptional regulator, partial [Fibrobacterota bacterium]
MASVLIVDDEGKMRSLIGIVLSGEGHEIEEAGTAEAALEKLATGLKPDVVITDIRMPGKDGISLLKEVKALLPVTEVIVMTAHADAKTGVEAMKNGAFEYLAKPFEMDELILLVKSAAEKHRLKAENESLKQELSASFSIANMIGLSKPMQEIFRQIKQVGPRDTTVIIRGKSGTGKELVARALHHESGRKEFTAINCSALPANLLESELFGHEKGSFTGAHKAKPGLFETAGAGTIFLDEVGDLPPDLQVKLLRVLQERTFRRVGGTSDLVSRARVVSATNRNLEDAVQEGRFREDLYYRLNVFTLFMPALSERRDDIPLLARHFVKKYHSHGIDEAALEALQRYGWPGNVRELENVIQQAGISAGDLAIGQGDVPRQVREGLSPAAPSTYRLPESGINIEQVEKEFILQALEKASGNKTRAAELLGISRRAIYSRMKT